MWRELVPGTPDYAYWGEIPQRLGMGAYEKAAMDHFPPDTAFDVDPA